MENNNEFNQDVEEKTKAITTYTAINAKKEKARVGFGRGVILPFLCGALGTIIVIGIAFGVPNVRNKLFTNIPTDEHITINNIEENSKEASTQEEQKLQNENQTENKPILYNSYSEIGINVANKVRPSIVGITVEYSVNSIFYRNYYGNTSTSKAEGSGIIISENGYILTNNHIINTSSNSSYFEVSKASKVSVYLYNDETEYPAEIIGTDEQTDLAVIKINKSGLTAAELGDSDQVQVGEFAMAIGNPLGMQSSVTSGMISAVNRTVTDSDGKQFKLIQTDAAINAGNSGGALVNSNGQVIGVNTLKLQGTGIEGIGFAIPINSTKSIYEQLIEFNKVKRPFIGITGRDLDEKTATTNNLVVGVYIQSIEDFSSAQKADMRIGDVIIEADNKKITSMQELNEIKNSHNIGDTLKLKVFRNGQEKEINVILGEQ